MSRAMSVYTSPRRARGTRRCIRGGTSRRTAARPVPTRWSAACAAGAPAACHRRGRAHAVDEVGPVLRREELADVLPDDLFRRVAEHPLGRGVEQGHACASSNMMIASIADSTTSAMRASDSDSRDACAARSRAARARAAAAPARRSCRLFWCRSTNTETFERSTSGWNGLTCSPPRPPSSPRRRTALPC